MHDLLPDSPQYAHSLGFYKHLCSQLTFMRQLELCMTTHAGLMPQGDGMLGPMVQPLDVGSEALNAAEAAVSAMAANSASEHPQAALECCTSCSHARQCDPDIAAVVIGSGVSIQTTNSLETTQPSLSPRIRHWDSIPDACARQRTGQQPEGRTLTLLLSRSDMGVAQHTTVTLARTAGGVQMDGQTSSFDLVPRLTVDGRLDVPGWDGLHAVLADGLPSPQQQLVSTRMHAL